MTPPYSFALLNPAKAPHSKENAAFLGAMTLGVEVTAKAFVPHCGLGNIDFQHGPCATSGQAAIEAALDWPLPPKGSCLVTVRADADALGAMAVLLLRAEGHQISSEVRARIAEIARWDGLRLGSWKPWRRLHPPLFRPAMAVDLMGKPLELKAVDALVRMDSWSMEQRVLVFAAWLDHGRTSLPDEVVQAALDFESRLLDAWNSADIDVRLSADPRVVVMTAAPGAPVGGMDIAYRLAPVVIAEGHMPWGRKLTIAQFEPGWVNLRALAANLNALEPGWGGQPDSIIGSRQGAACKLKLSDVEALASGWLQHAPLWSSQ